MSKTKEEILSTKHWNEEYPNYMQESEIHDAMDEHSRQQSIAFSEWMAAEGYVTYDGFDRWIAPHNNNNVYSANELYSMFLTHQSQQK